MLTIQVFQLEIERMIDQDGRFRLWRYRRLRFRLDSRFRVVRLRRLCFRGKAVPQYDCSLIQAARQLPASNDLRAVSNATLFGLLAVTGMRVGEAIGLDCKDVDLNQGLLTVRQAKFNKSRLVPIHFTTQKKLREYERLRNRRCPQPKSLSFFLSERGTRLNDFTVRRWFIIASRQIGLRAPTDRRGPRIHDLRHLYAFKTISNWYRRGMDVEAHLPELTTYILLALLLPANIQDRDGARQLLARFFGQPARPRVKHIWADGGYAGALVDWARQVWRCTVEIVKRSDSHTFRVLPRRWVVERTFGWLGRCRRLNRDYERQAHTGEVMVYLAMIRLMLARLAKN